MKFYKLLLFFYFIIPFCSFVPFQSIQNYPWEVDSIIKPYIRISENQLKSYWKNPPRTDTMYSYFYRLNLKKDSLNDKVWDLVRPSENSPFFHYNTILQTFSLVSECQPKVRKAVDSDLLMWIDFILSYSMTYKMTGEGPTVILSNSTHDKSTHVNYSQLLAALTWFRVNERRISPNAFILYSASKNCKNWYNVASDLSFSCISDSFKVEIAESLLSVMYVEEVEMRDSLRNAIEISSLIHLYNEPEKDKEKYRDYKNSFISPFVGVSYDLQYF